MSHVRRKPSKHPRRVVKQAYSSRKLSKRLKIILLFAFIILIFVISGAAAGLIFLFA